MPRRINRESVGRAARRRLATRRQHDADTPRAHLGIDFPQLHYDASRVWRFLDRAAAYNPARMVVAAPLLAAAILGGPERSTTTIAGERRINVRVWNIYRQQNSWRWASIGAVGELAAGGIDI